LSRMAKHPANEIGARHLAGGDDPRHDQGKPARVAFCGYQAFDHAVHCCEASLDLDGTHELALNLEAVVAPSEKHEGAARVDFALVTRCAPLSFGSREIPVSADGNRPAFPSNRERAAYSGLRRCPTDPNIEARYREAQ